MDAPKCKICGEKHWGICSNHEAKGAVIEQFKKSTLPQAVGAATHAKGGAGTSGSDSLRDEAGANPAKLQVAAGKKSTAARKDVPSADVSASGASAHAADSDSGYQAPPVDITTRGTPRKRAPKGTVDRKAYKAKLARERRAKAKA